MAFSQDGHVELIEVGINDDVAELQVVVASNTGKNKQKVQDTQVVITTDDAGQKVSRAKVGNRTKDVSDKIGQVNILGSKFVKRKDKGVELATCDFESATIS